MLLFPCRWPRLRCAKSPEIEIRLIITIWHKSGTKSTNRPQVRGVPGLFPLALVCHNFQKLQGTNQERRTPTACRRMAATAAPADAASMDSYGEPLVFHRPAAAASPRRCDRACLPCEPCASSSSPPNIAHPCPDACADECQSPHASDRTAAPNQDRRCGAEGRGTTA